MGLSLDLSSPPTSPPPTAKLSTATSGQVSDPTDAAASKPAPAAQPSSAAGHPGPPMAARSEGHADMNDGSASACGRSKLEAGTSKAAGIK